MERSNKITRATRAQIRRRAQEIRLRGDTAGWRPVHIVTAMRAELPELHPLEAWRLANGWVRTQVITGIADLYRQAGLHAPPLNSSMLCRWEHGDGAPSAEYADALCRLYQATPRELGLVGASPFIACDAVPIPRVADDALTAAANTSRPPDRANAEQFFALAERNLAATAESLKSVELASLGLAQVNLLKAIYHELRYGNEQAIGRLTGG